MVFRLETHGEAQIAFGVFMTAINLSIVRQRHQFFKRGVHLLRCSLEEAAASRSEQGIPAEKIVTQYISDVAGRVTGNKEDPAAKLTDGNFIAFIHAVGESRNSFLIALVAVDFEFVSG